MSDKDLKPEYDFSQGRRGEVIATPTGKERITIRLDKDILDWFRHQASEQGGGNYQTLINQVLRDYTLSHQAPLEEMLRRVIREELSQYKVE